MLISIYFTHSFICHQMSWNLEKGITDHLSEEVWSINIININSYIKSSWVVHYLCFVTLLYILPGSPIIYSFSDACWCSFCLTLLKLVHILRSVVHILRLIPLGLQVSAAVSSFHSVRGLSVVGGARLWEHSAGSKSSLWFLSYFDPQTGSFLLYIKASHVSDRLSAPASLNESSLCILLR